MKGLGLVLAGFLPASQAWGASLDVTADFRLRTLGYTNLNLSSDRNNQAFFSQNARLGFLLKKIELASIQGVAETMEVGLAFRGVGIAGSTSPVQRPFDRIASNYPGSNFAPFLENAYVRVFNLFGYPWETTLGRQSFKLGSGLLLQDDGAGLTGVSMLGNLPFLDMKWGGFFFETRANQIGSGNLDIFGVGFELPLEGTWQVSHMVESDKAIRTELTFPVSRVTRHFSSVRYSIAFGRLTFDGEAALETGNALVSGTSPTTSKVTLLGNAQVFQGSWKAPMWKLGEGLFRATIGRGSGDKGGTPSRDEAFSPSNGHRFYGLERSGYGEFYGASLYDALASSDTFSGLPDGTSGVQVVGFGVTLPPYKGIVPELDYYLFKADTHTGANGDLGGEWDAKLRYEIGEKFSLKASAAFFTSGNAYGASRQSARRLMFQATARF